MKKNLRDIKTDLIHNNTVFRKKLITAEEHKGKIATCNYAWLEKGKQIEIHSHPDSEELYLFLAGEGKMLVGDEWMAIEKDDFITVPKGKNHSVKNSSEQNLVFITLRMEESISSEK